VVQAFGVWLDKLHSHYECHLPKTLFTIIEIPEAAAAAMMIYLKDVTSSNWLHIEISFRTRNEIVTLPSEQLSSSSSSSSMGSIIMM